MQIFLFSLCVYACVCMLGKKWKISIGRELLMKTDKDTKKSDC